MTAAELIEAVKSATDKNSLELLVPHIAFDKRKGLTAIKAFILDALQGDTNAIHGIEIPAPELVATSNLGEFATTGAQDFTQEPEFILPEIEPEDEPEVAQTGNRLLRHKASGRVVVWTSALARIQEWEEA